MIMDKKLIIAVSAIVVVTVLVIFYMSNTSLSGGGNSPETSSTLHITNYQVQAEKEGPAIEITFSQVLTVGAAVLLEKADYSDVGVYACTQPTSTVIIHNITPPNLIGQYYIVVDEENKEVLNKSIVFQEPTVQIVNYHINKVEKGNTVYIVNLTINITEYGNTPFYYTEMIWSMDNSDEHVYKLPREHISPEEESSVTLYVNEQMNTGEQHTIVVVLSFYSLSAVQFSLSFST